MPDLQADIARRVKRDSKAGMPAGGIVGRVLTKASGADYDADWMPSPGLPPGGVKDQVLRKLSYVDGDADWRPGIAAQVDSYLDATGVSVTTSGTLPWVIDPGTGATLPSAGLLDLSTPTAPVVIADGYFTFDMWVATGGTNADARIVYSVNRGVDIALIGTTACPSSATATLANAHAFSFSYPCLAGDVIAVTIQNDGTTVQYLLAGSVKSSG